MDHSENCGCDESKRLRRRTNLRRLEVLELKLRARSVELRYQHISAIPELAVAQKTRRDRNRERLIAAMALRSFAR